MQSVLHSQHSHDHLNHICPQSSRSILCNMSDTPAFIRKLHKRSKSAVCGELLVCFEPVDIPDIRTDGGRCDPSYSRYGFQEVRIFIFQPELVDQCLIFLTCSISADKVSSSILRVLAARSVYKGWSSRPMRSCCLFL